MTQQNRTAGRDRFLDEIRPLGDQAGSAGLIGLIWLGGKVFGDETATAIGEDAVEASLLTSLLVVPILKSATGRSRPDAGQGAIHFEPFSGSDSFPSGGAAQTFSIASVVSGHARSPWIRGAGWGLAGLVSYGSIPFDRQWLSDVVAGAVIGSAVGSWVVHRRHIRTSAAKEGLPIAVVPPPGGLQLRGDMTW